MGCQGPLCTTAPTGRLVNLHHAVIHAELSHAVDVNVAVITKHCCAGAGPFIVFFSFFGVNKHTAKTSQCKEAKLGVQIGYSNLTCNVVLILLPCHLPPLAGTLNPTEVDKFGDFPGGAENAGVENAGVENAGVDSRGGKCRSGKCRRDNVWKVVRTENS